MYPDPSAFIPERFLPDKNGNVARDPVISGTFGFGRRSVSFLNTGWETTTYLALQYSVCAGRHLADASIWIIAASLLSVFNLTSALDEYGQKIDVGYARDPVPGFFRWATRSQILVGFLKFFQPSSTIQVLDRLSLQGNWGDDQKIGAIMIIMILPRFTPFKDFVGLSMWPKSLWKINLDNPAIKCMHGMRTSERWDLHLSGWRKLYI